MIGCLGNYLEAEFGMEWIKLNLGLILGFIFGI